MTSREFSETLWDFYAKHGRHDLPWRQALPGGGFDPYAIMVSELMLQQTQVSRVIPKFEMFMQTFPTVQRLAAAPLAEVLIAWSGLGYNRRAKFLWQAAQLVCDEFDGQLPTTPKELVQLPGVGSNTAGAIVTYAFNQPVLFIETNIRTVYIHHFFHDATDVPDAAILELLEQTLDHEQPREFYWALMDYGSFLKQTVGNVSRYSRSYAKQSTFEGSRRQIRGQVLKLLAGGPQSPKALAQQLPDERLPAVLADLLTEGLIRQQSDQFTL